jgi:hypothetical protein
VRNVITKEKKQDKRRRKKKKNRVKVDGREVIGLVQMYIELNRDDVQRRGRERVERKGNEVKRIMAMYDDDDEAKLV